MVRNFSTDPVDRAVIDRIVRAALRSPTAGNTRGTAWVVLEGADQTSAYWAATTDDDWRNEHAEWAAGLMGAPVVALAYTSPEAYVARYAEPDKADPLLGAQVDHWPIPYWYGDAAFGVMSMLLGAVDAGLGACVLGNFRGETELARSLGVPPPWRLFGTVVLGWPLTPTRQSRSLDRDTPAVSARIHRGSW